MKLTDVIRRPLVTEKSTLQRELTNVLAFEVAIGATKIEIAQAVETLLGAKVDDVRTAMTHGKVKRQGRFSGRRSDWKKAYVRLKPGEKVPDILEIA
jgi:large subunit ribosomal protein L23